MKDADLTSKKKLKYIQTVDLDIHSLNCISLKLTSLQMLHPVSGKDNNTISEFLPESPIQKYLS